MKPGTRHALKVSFELNETVPFSQVRQFIIHALESWGGQFHPDDPLFGSLEDVRVSGIKENAP